MTVTALPNAPFRGAGIGAVSDNAGSLFTVPAGVARRLLGFNFDIKTSTQVGARFVGYELVSNEGEQTYFEALSPPLEKISQTYGICAYIGAPYMPSWPTTDGKEPATWGRTLLLPLPNIWLPAGWKIKYTSVKQSEDSFPLFRTLYEDVPAGAGAA